ncbi:MAG: VOC family protein [Haloferacaceae archaeon]
MDVIHAALWVDDLDAMLSFYVDGVGLDERRSFAFRGTENVYVGGDHGEIQFRHDPDGDRGPVAPDRSTVDHVAVGVADVDRAFADLVERTGCPVVEEPMTVEQAGTRVAFVEDPEGYVLELVEEA